MKKLNKKGFTLAELLIVVAIIAVLVAITIPVFSSALNKANQARDAATVRAEIAELLVDEMTDPAWDGGNINISVAGLLPLEGGSTLTGGAAAGVAVQVVHDGCDENIEIPVDEEVIVAIVP